MENKRNNTLINIMGKLLLGLMLVFAMPSVWAAETITYYHNDALGSPIAATDENGKILWKEDYHPYGARIRKESTDSNQQWYTGKHHENDIGLTYFGARWYDPTIGRFMAIDPVGFKESNIQSYNRYAYANNNPYLFVDPDGRESVASVKERLSTGKTLRHPAGGNSSSFPATMNPVPGFEPPMSSGELIGIIGSFASPAGAVRQSVKWGAGKFVTKSASSSVNGLKLQKQLASQEQLGQLSKGGGTVISQPAKQANRIAAQTGRNPANIQKVSSDVRVAKDGQQIQTHSFRDASTNKLIEPKTIIGD